MAVGKQNPDQIPLIQRFGSPSLSWAAGPLISQEEYAYIVILASGEVVRTQWHRSGQGRPELSSLVGVLGGPTFANLSSAANPEDFLGQVNYGFYYVIHTFFRVRMREIFDGVLCKLQEVTKASLALAGDQSILVAVCGPAPSLRVYFHRLTVHLHPPTTAG